MISWEQAGDAEFLAQEPPEEPLYVERPDGIRHPSPLAARVFIGLIRAGAELERGLDAELQAAHGIGLHGFEVLLHLAAFSPNRTARVSTLVAQAPLSQSRVSRLVGELEARGLVERRPCATDSRGVEVQITPGGLHLLREAQEKHFEGLDRRFLSRFTWQDLVELARILAKLRPDP